MYADPAAGLILFHHKLHARNGACYNSRARRHEGELLSGADAARYPPASRRSSAVEQLIRNQ